MTYKQAQEIGGQVHTGEHGSLVLCAFALGDHSTMELGRVVVGQGERASKPVTLTRDDLRA